MTPHISRILVAPLLLMLDCGPAPTGTFLREEVPVQPTPAIAEVIIPLVADATGVTMTNAAVAGTEFPNNVSRVQVDLAAYSSIRAHFASSLTSSVIGLRIEYSLNSGSTWTTLVPQFQAGSTANQNNTSAWTSLSASAQTDVLLRALVVGDGVLDPVIRYVRIGIAE